MTRRFKNINPTEDQIHTTLVAWLKQIQHQGRNLLFFHSPNGGYRNAQEGAKFKRMGVLAGVSDITLLEPTKTHHGLFIELKKNDGRLTQSQKVFLAKASERGYATAVCYSVAQAQREVTNYLAGEMEVGE